MKVLRFLGVIAIICGFTGLAGATPVTFHMHVLDPPPVPNPSYTLYPISGTSFNVTFSACVSGELPGLNTADGCFAGHNVSGQDWEELDLAFAETGPLVGGTADCTAAISNNAYSNIDCPASAQNSIFSMGFSTDGLPNEGIPNGAYFFITEDGVVPATDFPDGTAMATVITPEPGSIVLLSTGLLLFGFLFNIERRRTVRSSLLS